MKVLLSSATAMEIGPIIKHLDQNFHKVSFSHYTLNDLEIRVVVTGIGMLFTAQSLTKALDLYQTDLCLHAGIAGAFDKQAILGSTCQVVCEQFGDLGAELADGSFQDIFELNLQTSDRYPFNHAMLSLTDKCPRIMHLPGVKGLTVNTVTGTAARREELFQKYAPDLESMEGLAVFYCALCANVPFISLRSISNHVGPRDKTSWKMDIAIQNLSTEIIGYFSTLALG